MAGRQRVIVGSGPRELERCLLAELRAGLDEARREPALLGRPLRVVVPSRSLAQHVCALLVREVGQGVAAVRVQTLHALALEVIDAAGERAARGDDLFGILVRRASRVEAPLRDALDGLEDGYAAVTGAVADLLDAGFAHDVPAHLEAVDEALLELALPGAVRERVRALVRVAAAVGRALAGLGLGRRGSRMAHAAQLLSARPALLRSRALWIHGFADATGVASDLLEVLVAGLGARALIDHPPDPARADRPDLGAAYTARLLRRLGGPDAPRAPGRQGRTRLSAIRAAGTDVEVRAVADRVHDLLEAGARPESVGVVARDLDAYAVALRTQLGRLGIAFSGSGALGPPTGRGRRIHALLDLISRGEALSAERWLEVWAELGRRRLADLRLGLHALGAPRLRDVAALDTERLLGGAGYLPLPARRGLAAAREGGDGDVGPRAQRRRLSAGLLRRAVEAARAVCDQLESWPREAPLAAHTEQLRRLVRERLGWRDGPERRDLDAALAALRAELPDPSLSFEELVVLLRRVLAGSGADRLGGAGAGVQVLSVVEARGRSFEHLFVLGLNRDLFPRPLVDDPLLPDAVRRRLEPLLPEIPVKARGFEEEHFLFAQLLASSPLVTLSWQVANDEGRARAASPFVERLRSAGHALPCEDAPSLQAPPQRAVGRPRTAAEAAIGEALHGSPARFRELLPLVAGECEALDPRALARGRAAVLDELADRPGGARLSPYFGFVGPPLDRADPRQADPFVTHVEGVVRCAWEHFLTRLLGLEPPRDALDSLPETTPLLIGNLVHRALERIVAAAGAARAVAIDPDAPGRAIGWPEPAALEELLHACAGELMAEEGLGPAGFARVLVEAARPLVCSARELGWPDADSPVRCLGAELSGAVEVTTPAGPRRIRFRADRVDRLLGAAGGDEALRLVDYKTGKGGDLKGRSAAERRAKLLASVAAGANLQAPAYALGAAGTGRYLFLARGAEEAAVFEADAADAEMRDAFAGAVVTALAAVASGSFLPRLTRPDEAAAPTHCDWCDVREACLQGDAGARARLFEWARAGAAHTPAESAALALWRLPQAGGT